MTRITILSPPPYPPPPPSLCTHSPIAYRSFPLVCLLSASCMLLACLLTTYCPPLASLLLLARNRFTPAWCRRGFASPGHLQPSQQQQQWPYLWPIVETGPGYHNFTIHRTSLFCTKHFNVWSQPLLHYWFRAVHIIKNLIKQQPKSMRITIQIYINHIDAPNVSKNNYVPCAHHHRWKGK